MADQMLIDREVENAQNDEMSFAVKPFYDAMHLNSYIRPTYPLISVPSRCSVDRLKGEISPPIKASPTFADGQVFEITLTRCYVNYLCALRLPRRVGILLPSFDIIATFICHGKRYKIKYFGERKIKMFGSGWRYFVGKLKLEEGDRIKFEVREASDQKLILDVDIIKCNPSSRLYKERMGVVETQINA